MLSPSLQKGLTLIEILIVVAIIGLLSAIVIITINPMEQLAKGRDALRKSAVGQLGHAVDSYVVSRGGTSYPGIAAFQTDLQRNKDISNIVSAPTYRSGINSCNPVAGGSEGRFCYNTDGTSQAVVWVRLESRAEGGSPPGNAVCAPPGFVAYWVFSTIQGRAGRVCGPPGAFTPGYDVELGQ